MTTRKPVIALMYDFDKTLCTKDMQEYAFIPKLGMTPKQFWAESNNMAISEGMDRILAYMYIMIEKANAAKQSVRREDFVKLGEAIEFFPGVKEWFGRIDEYGKLAGAKIEHYIISSGLKEIIEGSAIRKHFEKIYACEFHYDASGVADWPRIAVNYTAKTQFLFRINKCIPDISDDDALNEYIPEEKRRVPFRNMIYIGDGLTDVPCMKLVKVNGGQSIAVYPRQRKNKVVELLRNNRVNYLALADYSEGSELDGLVKQIIDQMVATDTLFRISQRQYNRLPDRRK